MLHCKESHIALIRQAQFERMPDVKFVSDGFKALVRSDDKAQTKGGSDHMLPILGSQFLLQTVDVPVYRMA